MAGTFNKPLLPTKWWRIVLDGVKDRISYEEVDLFSTSESDKEARGESDKKLVIKK